MFFVAAGKRGLGFWLSIAGGEVLSILLSVYYFRHFKGKYHYA